MQWWHRTQTRSLKSSSREYVPEWPCRSCLAQVDQFEETGVKSDWQTTKRKFRWRDVSTSHWRFTLCSKRKHLRSSMVLHMAPATDYEFVEHGKSTTDDILWLVSWEMTPTVSCVLRTRHVHAMEGYNRQDISIIRCSRHAWWRWQTCGKWQQAQSEASGRILLSVQAVLRWWHGCSTRQCLAKR